MLFLAQRFPGSSVAPEAFAAATALEPALGPLSESGDAGAPYETDWLLHVWRQDPQIRFLKYAPQVVLTYTEV